MRVCIGEGRVRVACSLLYPIFKFRCNKKQIHTESVYLSSPIFFGFSDFGEVLFFVIFVCRIGGFSVSTCHYDYDFAFRWSCGEMLNELLERATLGVFEHF